MSLGLKARRVYKLMGGLAPTQEPMDVNVKVDDQGRPWVFVTFGSGNEEKGWALDLITAGRVQIALAALLFHATGGNIGGTPSPLIPPPPMIPRNGRPS